jgi:hypothetical protein
MSTRSAEEHEDDEFKARLWKKADAKFGRAVSVTSNSRTIDMQWASLLYQLAKSEGGHGAASYLTRADKKYEMLAAFSPDGEIYAEWGNLHLLWAEHRAFSSWSAASKQVTSQEITDRRSSSCHTCASNVTLISHEIPGALQDLCGEVGSRDQTESYSIERNLYGCLWARQHCT